jgi:hypothetical protein
MQEPIKAVYLESVDHMVKAAEEIPENIQNYCWF